MGVARVRRVKSQRECRGQKEDCTKILELDGYGKK